MSKEEPRTEKLEVASLEALCPRLTLMIWTSMEV
jgi:hypothetical protein